MNEIDALYQDALKHLAQTAHGGGRLPAAMNGKVGEARLDNPLCGDRVSMQVTLGRGHIDALAHETRGCLLCRAAASAIGLRAPGLDPAAIEGVADSLEGSLKHGAAPPAAWPELAVFAPARDYPGRHGCILLPFRALLAALRNVPAPEIST